MLSRTEQLAVESSKDMKQVTLRGMFLEHVMARAKYRHRPAYERYAAANARDSMVIEQHYLLLRTISYFMRLGTVKQVRAGYRKTVLVFCQPLTEAELEGLHAELG